MSLKCEADKSLPYEKYYTTNILRIAICGPLMWELLRFTSQVLPVI